MVKARLQGSAQRVRTFFADVMGEMRKSTWPNRQELVESTIVVVASLILLSFFVGVADRILFTVLRLLIPAG